MYDIFFLEDIGGNRMRKTIVIINGTGGSGKDTFVSFCGEFAKVLNVSTVDRVKMAASILVDWNGEKDEKSRKLLADLKQLSVRYNNAPTRYIKSRADEFEKSEDEIMFIHIREAEEIRKCQELLGAETLLITNPRKPLITSNDSDGKVNEFSYDYYICNDGTVADLKDKAEEFVKGLQATHQDKTKNKIKQ